MDLVGIQPTYVFRVGADPEFNFLLDADANDCKYSVTVDIQPVSPFITSEDFGSFINHDIEFVRLWTKMFPPSVTIA